MSVLHTPGASAKPVLVVVDVQRYYLEEGSDYYKYFRVEESTWYLERLKTAVPAMAKLLAGFRAQRWPVAFLRIASRFPDRSDLHRFFRDSWQKGSLSGVPAVYPLVDDLMSEITPDLAPEPGEQQFIKGTFSAFSSCPAFEQWLKSLENPSLVMTGLCTSQCVETTARDASDRGFPVVLVEDALVDYEQDVHYASLWASRAVCGGMIVTSDEFLQHPLEICESAGQL